MIQSRHARAALGLLAAAPFMVGPAYAQIPSFETTTYLCRQARSAHAPRGEPKVARFAKRRTTAIDRYSSSDANDQHAIDVKKPSLLCEPDGGSGINLEAYAVATARTRPKQPPFAPRIEQVQLRQPWGDRTTVSVSLTAAGALLVPSIQSGSGGATPPANAALRCYDASLAPTASGLPAPKVTPRPRYVVYRGQSLYVQVTEPVRLCVPAELDGTSPQAPGRRDGLLCSRAALVRLPSQAALPVALLSSQNHFGDEILRLNRPHEVCEPVELAPVAADACPAASPTATPIPTATPTAARDTLESLSLSPPTIARLPGESKHFVVTGHFPGGVTADLSDEVTFASSNPTVAVAPNDPADPNRIDLLAKGTTTISATDPVTGVTSTASGGDATLIATGPLQYITVSPQDVGLRPCGSVQLTATGHYEDGVERNLTQDVVWSTTAPTVAIATNPVGRRSRIDALSPGQAGVIATDPTTGTSSYCCGDSYCCPTISVMGQLQAIFLEETPKYSGFTPARVPAIRRLAAIGFYEGGVHRSGITESLVFHSSDSSVVQTPNETGDRGKLLVVGGGTAAISASDPETGVISTLKYLRALDGLLSLAIPDYNNPQFAVGVGGTLALTVLGQFADGPAIVEAAFISSDPTIASTQGRFITGVKPGVVTISAVDPLTGISTADSGHDITLGVRGAPLRLTMDPPSTKRLVGQSEGYLVQVHYEGGFAESISQRVQLTAANPAVGHTSSQWPYTLVDAVGPGTTTISAFDPGTGLSTATSGDDATFTVLASLASLTIRPTNAVRAGGRSYFYAAIGRDLDGEEINLTQDVTWSSSDPGVASATNPDGERSRVDTLTPGTTIISAIEPLTGMTSAGSNGDATLEVIGKLHRLVLSSTVVTFRPGEEWQLTTTGEDRTGRTTNLTQEVVYTSSAPGVVAATNDPDHRSRIVAIAPGTATLSAKDPVSGLVSSAGGNIVLTVTPP